MERVAAENNENVRKAKNSKPPAQVASLRGSFDETLRDNEDLKKAAGALEDARIMRLAAETYFKAPSLAAGEALDYAWHLRRLTTTGIPETPTTCTPTRIAWACRTTAADWSACASRQGRPAATADSATAKIFHHPSPHQVFLDDPLGVLRRDVPVPRPFGYTTHRPPDADPQTVALGAVTGPVRPRRDRLAGPLLEVLPHLLPLLPRHAIGPKAHEQVPAELADTKLLGHDGRGQLFGVGHGADSTHLAGKAGVDGSDTIRRVTSHSNCRPFVT